MKIIVLFFIAIAFQLPSHAQSLFEEEVAELLPKIDEEMNNEHFQEALDMLLLVVEGTKQQRGESERIIYIYSQMKASYCYYQLSQFENGYRICEQLLSDSLSDDELLDLRLTQVLNGCGLAIDMILDEKYEESRKLSNSILPFAEGNIKQMVLRNIPRAWFSEGQQYSLHQRHEEALYCMGKARDGFHELHDIEHECEATCETGRIKIGLGDYKGAIEFFTLALDMAKESKNEDLLFSILNKQYIAYKELGDAETSSYFYSQTDSLARVTTSDKVKYEYNNFKGDEFKKQKKYKIAEQWYLKNERFVKMSYDENYLWANEIRFYLNLHSLNIDKENYNKALEYSRKMLELDKSQNKVNVFSYYNMAYDYQKLRDNVNCFHYLDSMFLLIDKFEEPREIANFYWLRGLVHLNLSMYDSALKDNKKADEILAVKYDENDKKRVELLCNIGALEYKLKNYERAIKYQTAYAEKVKVLYGEGSPSYLNALTYLAKAEGYGGNIVKGSQLFSLAAKKIRDRIRIQLPFYSSGNREQLWEELLNGMTVFSLDTKNTQTDFTEACYDNFVLTKSFLLQTERSSFDVIKKNGTDSDLHDFMVIANLNRRIEDLEKDSEVNGDSITTLISHVDSLERELLAKCRAYGDLTSFMNIGYKDIKGALCENEVLIDFADFYPEDGGRVYASYLVEPNQDYPLLKELFAESAIDSLCINSLAKYYNSSKGQKVTELIWEPLKNHVKEGATVYYVPSQLLFQIALESLPLEDGTLLGDHYNFIRLSSAREVLNVRSHFSLDMARQADAVLYGGLEYDVQTDTMIQESKKYDVSHLVATRGEEARGDSIFSPLPYTKEEIEKITGILQNYDVSIHSYSGAEGTEESFVSMNGKSPKILHVATHGFYYTPDKANETNYLRGYTDAMLLSGIVLSGGNAAWRGKELPEKVMEGILTAYDIARLDLSNTELVVLSACQTGRGEATAEGLYGLQRAFKKAGVKTIVMSLWNINDKETKEFMVKFYENLAGNQWNKLKAFNETKNYIRNKYADPYYWAGFVMLD